MAATILSSLTKSTIRDASSLDIAFPFPLFPFPSVPPSSSSFPPPPPRCCPSPSTTSSSAVDPAIVIAHVVVRRHQHRHFLPSTPTSLSPTLSSPTSSLPMSTPTSLFAAAAAAAAVRRHDRRFRRYRCQFLVDCCMWNPPHPLHHSSRRSMTSSYHRGRRCRTTPTPADARRGGHRVIVVLPHRRPSSLAATACLPCRCSCRCHPHPPRRRQNDRRRWQRSMTAGRCGGHIVVADCRRRRGRLECQHFYSICFGLSRAVTKIKNHCFVPMTWDKTVLSQLCPGQNIFF